MMKIVKRVVLGCCLLFAFWLFTPNANAVCYCVALKSVVGIKTGMKIGSLTDGCQETCLGVSSCGTVCNMASVSAGSCEFVVTEPNRTCSNVTSAPGCCVCNDGTKDTTIGSDKACGLVCQAKKGKKSWNMGVCEEKPAAAAPSGPPPKKSYPLYNAIGTTSIPEVMGRVINVFLGIVGAVALAVFVYGGVLWMTARGSQKQTDTARGAIVNAVVGLAIIAFSYALANSVITMLTTMPVPPPEQLPSEQATQAEVEKAQEQTSIQEQQAKEEKLQQQGAEQEAAKTACPAGYQCINGMSLSQMDPGKVSKSCVNANPMPGNPAPCGQSGMCCNF